MSTARNSILIFIVPGPCFFDLCSFVNSTDCSTTLESLSIEKSIRNSPKKSTLLQRSIPTVHNNRVIFKTGRKEFEGGFLHNSCRVTHPLSPSAPSWLQSELESESSEIMKRKKLTRNIENPIFCFFCIC